MLRLLLALLLMFIFGIAWRLIRALAPPASAPRGDGKTRMVKCAVCDLYVPEDEAEKDNGRYYCSTSHRLTGTREERK